MNTTKKLKIKFHIIQNNVWKNALFRIYNYIKMQLQITAEIVQLRKYIDIFTLKPQD